MNDKMQNSELKLLSTNVSNIRDKFPLEMPIAANINILKSMSAKDKLSLNGLKKSNRIKESASENIVSSLAAEHNFKPKTIRQDDIEYGKDIAVLKIALGMFISYEQIDEYEDELKLIENFNYKLRMQEQVEIAKELRDELSDSQSERDTRLIFLFRDIVFKIYMDEYDKYCDENDIKINMEQFAVSLLISRFSKTNFRKPLSKKFKRKRILDERVLRALKKLRISEIDILHESFGHESKLPAFEISERIAKRVAAIKIPIKKI